jgi:hypothetical protein
VPASRASQKLRIAGQRPENRVFLGCSLLFHLLPLPVRPTHWRAADVQAPALAPLVGERAGRYRAERGPATAVCALSWAGGNNTPVLAGDSLHSVSKVARDGVLTRNFSVSNIPAASRWAATTAYVLV